MGNAESAIVRNVDKRTSRREHRETFEAAAKRFRAAPFPAPPQPNGGLAGRNVRVCIRKRPMFPHEAQQGEFDAITCLPRRVVVHDARMHPDMVHMFMNHHDFVFDEAFDEHTGNSDVYARTACDMVQRALEGGHGSAMMYGQTGSGKTYTMKAIYECVATDIFTHPGSRVVTVCFIELFGDNCFDMLNQGNSCNLATAPDGSVHPYPSVEVEVRDAAELLALIEMAAKLRATAATGVHDQSSRSHALCRIFIGPPADGGDRDFEGSLTLVDLAGSEHRIDNAEHNAERRKEGAKINASLAALKDCIRATAAGAKFVAFRQNRLTQLLRGCFAGVERHHTVVIATVSPSSKDTEHSLNTLRHACIMDGQGEAKAGQGSHLQGGAVTKELLGEVNVTKIARERKAKKKEGGDQGKPDEWVKPPPAHQSKQSNTGARAALDRRCVQALPPRVARDLIEARSVFGTLRQRQRLSRVPPPQAVEAPEEEHSAPASARDDRASGHKRQPRSRSAAPAPCTAAEGTGNGSEGSGGGGSQGSDYEMAFELFRGFCKNGRQAREWRKNDLRLINTCVVPLLYGTGARIDWGYPNLALDQLEQLVAQGSELQPPIVVPPTVGEGGAVKPATSEKRGSKPPALPPSASAPSTAGQQRVPESPLGETEQGRAERQAERPPAAAAPAAARGSRGARSASPAARGAQTPVIDPSVCSEPRADSKGPVTHQDAIRARRAALEEQRKQSVQQALAKNKVASMTREEEIDSLEQQLAAGTGSSAAAVGMRKRLAALKAAALREERAAAARRSASAVAAAGEAAAAASAPGRGRPAPAVVADAPLDAPATPAADGRALYGDRAPQAAAASPVASSGYVVAPSGDGSLGHSDAIRDSTWLPEPARPPPRPGTGKRQASLGGRGMGAAAAPWANDLSNEGVVQAG